MFSNGKYIEKFKAGNVLNVNESITSPNRRYRLILSSNGILYLNKESKEKSIWNSGNGSQGNDKPYECVMKNAGYLAINNSDLSKPIWISDYSTMGIRGEHPGAFLRVQDDGNVVLYDSQGKNALWSTGTDEKH